MHHVLFETPNPFFSLILFFSPYVLSPSLVQFQRISFHQHQGATSLMEPTAFCLPLPLSFFLSLPLFLSPLHLGYILESLRSVCVRLVLNHACRWRCDSPGSLLNVWRAANAPPSIVMQTLWGVTVEYKHPYLSSLVCVRRPCGS